MQIIYRPYKIRFKHQRLELK